MKSIWAKVTKAGDNTKNWFVQQITYKGKVSNVLPVYPYGFFAHAKTEKSLGLIFCVGGKTENKAGILFDPINRPELLEGEIAIYQPETNTIIKFLQSGKIEIKTDVDIQADCANLTANVTTKATVIAPDIELTGAVHVTGTLTVTGATTLETTLAVTTSVTGGTIQTGNGVTLDGHTHGFDYDGAGDNSSAQTGTTDAP